MSDSATSTTSSKEVTSSEPQATQPVPPQARAPLVTVKGPPSGITVAGHGFWLLPPDPDGAVWAVFRPDGAYYFFPNDQQKK
jgi:hypothetical protein